MRIIGLTVLMAMAVSVGCSGESSPPADEKSSAPPRPAADVVGEVADGTVGQEPGATDRAEQGKRDAAKVGAGTKGQRHRGGYLSSVVRAPAHAEKTLSLGQANQALNLYKAAHGGRGPRTHEQYMEEIIKANHIKLAELPPGQRYVYDPKTEKLTIEQIEE